jgi:hypothetical protein
MSKLKMPIGEDAHLTDEGVALYVDALKLDTRDQLPALLREHVADCHDCKKKITGVYALLEGEDFTGVSAHPTFVLPAERERGFAYSAWNIAAIIAAVTVISTLTYYWVALRPAATTEHPKVATVPQTIDSVGRKAEPPTHGREEFAANFTPQADLEDLVASTVRSEEIAVTVPANGAVTGPLPKFSWKSGQREGVRIVVMDNRGRTVATARVKNPAYIPGRPLGPGLYYWKLENDEETLYLGTFLVK